MPNGLGLGWVRLGWLARLIIIFIKDNIFARSWRAFNLVLAERSERGRKKKGKAKKREERGRGKGKERKRRGISSGQGVRASGENWSSSPK